MKDLRGTKTLAVKALPEIFWQEMQRQRTCVECEFEMGRRDGWGGGRGGNSGGKDMGEWKGKERKKDLHVCCGGGVGVRDCFAPAASFWHFCGGESCYEGCAVDFDKRKKGSRRFRIEEVGGGGGGGGGSGPFKFCFRGE